MLLAARSTRPRADHAALKVLQSTITAKVVQELDSKIAASIKQSLSAGADYSQAMAERVCAALYDRMILERERAG
jgi:hypothetical protein